MYMHLSEVLYALHVLLRLSIDGWRRSGGQRRRRMCVFVKIHNSSITECSVGHSSIVCRAFGWFLLFTCRWLCDYDFCVLSW